MTLQAEFAATLVDEFARAGVRDAVLAPGSRSGPLALAIAADERLRLHVRLDERSAAFFALGTALSSGRPAVMLTTSGTASAEVHAAVLEADLARVPLIVCSADRPPELHQIGAPQTLEQSGLFGRAVRFFADAGLADEAGRPSWRSFASRLVAEAAASPSGPGPVHVNLAFREPLSGRPEALPPARADGEPWHRVAAGPGAPLSSVAALGEALAAGRRGAILAGGGTGAASAEVLVGLAEALGWPLLADARACRESHPSVICHADGILRSPAARAALAPEVLLRVGAPHASKVVATWCAELAAAAVPEVLVDPYGSFEDPERAAGLVLHAEPEPLFAALLAGGVPASPAAWARSWRRADDLAEEEIATVLSARHRLSEPAIAREVFSALSASEVLVCSSSMPVRDVEWYAPRRAAPPRVLSNRGANGIDGVTSTTLGVAAASGGHVVGLLGDLAFLHDVSGLVWGRLDEPPAATLVVVDNAGGGIFDFLDYPGTVEDRTYERLFGTPQRADVAAVATGFGLAYEEVDSTGAIAPALAAASRRGELSVIGARTDRPENVKLHAELSGAIVAALEAEFAR